MGRRTPRPLALLTVAVVAIALAWAIPATGHESRGGTRLPSIGRAPEFTLTTQDGRPLALGELRGKVVLVTFMYASCPDACPLLSAKLAAIARRLGDDGRRKVFFVSITVDPEHDTPAVLATYARGYGIDTRGWAFVTGTPAEIGDVARRYGIYRRTRERGDVDHTFLTSLVDRNGILRVQYLGVRFDPEEMLEDLRSLVAEGVRR